MKYFIFFCLYSSLLFSTKEEITEIDHFKNLVKQSDSVVVHIIKPTAKSYVSAINGSFLALDRLIYYKTLDSLHIIYLEKALFNYAEPSGKSRCYLPGKGISFYRSDTVFAFLEICLKCDRVATWGDIKIPISNLESENHTILKHIIK